MRGTSWKTLCQGAFSFWSIYFGVAVCSVVEGIGHRTLLWGYPADMLEASPQTIRKKAARCVKTDKAVPILDEYTDSECSCSLKAPPIAHSSMHTQPKHHVNALHHHHHCELRLLFCSYSFRLTAPGFSSRCPSQFSHTRLCSLSTSELHPRLPGSHRSAPQACS